jgi:hypothetical protein
MPSRSVLGQDRMGSPPGTAWQIHELSDTIFSNSCESRDHTVSSNTYIVRIPSADVPRDLKPQVESVLAELIPLVAARIKEKRQTDFNSLLDVLLGGVKLRTLDIRRAQKQAKALEAVLENSEWLTAEEVGERGKFSPSNLAAPANRWKQEGKIFAIPYQGQDRFPRYGLDEAFRPILALESVLKLLGPISPWRIAVWFESSNAWLDNHRPRELLSNEPEKVQHAAERYRNSSHG